LRVPAAAHLGPAGAVSQKKADVREKSRTKSSAWVRGKRKNWCKPLSGNRKKGRGYISCRDCRVALKGEKVPETTWQRRKTPFAKKKEEVAVSGTNLGGFSC